MSLALHAERLAAHIGRKAGRGYMPSASFSSESGKFSGNACWDCAVRSMLICCSCGLTIIERRNNCTHSFPGTVVLAFSVYALRYKIITAFFFSDRETQKEKPGAVRRMRLFPVVGFGSVAWQMAGGQSGFSVYGERPLASGG